MKALDDYLQKIQAQLTGIRATQAAALTQAAAWVAAALQHDGFIYTFGSGHSHVLAEETFYRAGGLVRAAAILDGKLMVHESASESTAWERREGYAAEVLARYPLKAGDVLCIVSNSGRNAVPIEMALEAKRRGAKTVAITSTQQSGAFASRHASGKKLAEVADVAIDNGGIVGDACVEIPGLPQRMGPASTITSAFILNGLFALAAEQCVAAGHVPEVYASINSDATSNDAYLAKYRSRIRHL